MKVRSRGVIVHDGELLVVQHANGQDFYALPGGHVDPGEDPKACITRELHEELGIVPEVGRLLFVYTYRNVEGVQAVEFFFEIKNGGSYREADLAACTHAHEIADARWVGPEDELRFLPPEFIERFKAGNAVPEETIFLKGE